MQKLAAPMLQPLAPLRAHPLLASSAGIVAWVITWVLVQVPTPVTRGITMLLGGR